MIGTDRRRAFWRLIWCCTAVDPYPGSFIHSLVATDICTGWTEAVPLLAREQSLIVEGLEAIGQRLPFRIRGIDSDNDGAFINETLIKYCVDRGIEFTRSRAYRSNDQAWIEQKNGSTWYAVSSAMIVTRVKLPVRPWRTSTGRYACT